MDGGWKSTATGLSGYSGIKHHHNVKTMRESRASWTATAPNCTTATGARAKSSRTTAPHLPDRDHDQQQHLRLRRRAVVAPKREWEWTAKDRITFMGMKKGLDLMPAAQRRQIFNGWKAPYELTSVQAGNVESVHEVTLENCFKQHLVPVEGQTDVLAFGLPYICPYNVNSVMNPILVMCLGLGYFFNMYRESPGVRVASSS